MQDFGITILNLISLKITRNYHFNKIKQNRTEAVKNKDSNSSSKQNYKETYSQKMQHSSYLEKIEREFLRIVREKKRDEKTLKLKMGISLFFTFIFIYYSVDK